MQSIILNLSVFGKILIESAALVLIDNSLSDDTAFAEMERPCLLEHKSSIVLSSLFSVLLS